MSAQHLTDAALFDRAVERAQDVMYWRRMAAQCAGSKELRILRLRFLRLARQAAARVVDLAIVAEQRCIREARP